MSAKPKVLIITAPDSPELRVLEGIAGDIDIVAVGQNAQDLASLSDEDWASVTVLLNCGVHHRTQQIVQLCLCVCLMSLSDVHAIICVSCRARPSIVCVCFSSFHSPRYRSRAKSWKEGRYRGEFSMAAPLFSLLV